MASQLNKTVRRITDATVFERSQLRNIIVSVEPARDGATIGFRLKGTRDIYRLPVGSLYVRAIEHHHANIEKRARQLQKSGMNRRSAVAQARKEKKEDLR